MLGNSKPTTVNTWALVRRAWMGLFADPGRVIDAAVEPILFFVTWGLFFAAGLVAPATAEILLLVNLIWACTSALYKQATQTVLFDFWSKEFIELFRVGVTARQYLLSMTLFGLSIGLTVVALYSLLAPITFAVPNKAILKLIMVLPIIGITAISVAYLSVAIIFRFSQLYAFAGGVLLQLSIALSSPFVPRQDLPIIWQELSYLFPLSWVFNAIHGGDTWQLIPGALIATAWLILGYRLSLAMFEHARSNGKLSRL